MPVTVFVKFCADGLFSQFLKIGESDLLRIGHKREEQQAEANKKLCDHVWGRRKKRLRLF